MPQIRVHQQCHDDVDRGRLIAYRNIDLSYCEITRRVLSTVTTVIRGMKKAEEHKEDQLVNLDVPQNIRLDASGN